MSLHLCHNWHQEIVFYGEEAECPLCAMLLERDEAIAKQDGNVAALVARVEELLDEKDALRSELRL